MDEKRRYGLFLQRFLQLGPAGAGKLRGRQAKLVFAFFDRLIELGHDLGLAAVQFFLDGVLEALAQLKGSKSS